MRFELKEPMTVFAKVKGPQGAVRELRALLDFNIPFCVMLSRDLVKLGYPEAALRPRDWQKTHPMQVPYMLSFRGIERSILVKASEISLGSLVVKEVETIVIDLDLPRMIPVELYLGRSFLNNFTLTVDGAGGFLSLVKPRGARAPTAH